MDFVANLLKKTSFRSDPSEDREKPKDDSHSETEKKQQDSASVSYPGGDMLPIPSANDGDEFDAFNDETFGDAAIEEDWEQQHEELASVICGTSPDKIEAINRKENLMTDNDCGWTPFSMEGFAFNLKPTITSISQIKPASSDSIVQGRQPTDLKIKPPRMFTLEEVENQLPNQLPQKPHHPQLPQLAQHHQQPHHPHHPHHPQPQYHHPQHQQPQHQQPQHQQPQHHPPQQHQQHPQHQHQQHPQHPQHPQHQQHHQPHPTLPQHYLHPQLLHPTPILPGFFQQRFPHQRRQFMTRPRIYYSPKENSDEYAGLMTRKDKEWLIKIQNSTLNSGNLYKEDFYYVSFKSRQLIAAEKAKKGDDGSQILNVIIPERKAEESSQAEYVPVQFDGSLGKIQVANIKCPRKLLDLDFKHSTKIIDPSQDRPATPVGRAELNAFRRLLLDIEQLYVVILDIDEEDKKMAALPLDQRTPHAEKRRELCNQLFKGVYDEKAETINKKIASVRKGIALIVRSLQVLNDLHQKAAIVKSLLEPSNSHYITNYREKGLHKLDFRSILTQILTQLRESKLPGIDNLTTSLNNLTISRYQTS